MKKAYNCCFCGKKISDIECNNPWPVSEDENDVCCSECNYEYVLPARLKLFMNNKEN